MQKNKFNEYCHVIVKCHKSTVRMDEHVMVNQAAIFALLEHKKLITQFLLDTRPLLTRNIAEGIITVVSNDTIVRCENYYEAVIPNQSFSTFKSHFRMTPTAFEIILEQLAHCPEFQKKDQTWQGGRDQINVEKSLLIALWTLATPDCYRSIADRFNVSESSVYTCLNNVIKAINNTLCKMYIQWPREHERHERARSFASYGLQHAVGVIDGCHIPIKRPQQNGNDYFNRKKFYSIVLQGICAKNLMFMDVDVSWPGSVHDARVFRTSDIFNIGQQLCTPYYYILGDSAYPCLPWLLVPYRNNGHLTREQRVYNNILSKTRVVIENAFALLKGRFRRLKDYLDRNSVQIIAETIVACCVLHNICILKDGDDLEEYIRQGREDIHERLPMIRGNQIFDERAGHERRNEVAREVWNIERLRNLR